MAKRLLIVSEPLTPPSYSPRLTSLIHYLEQRGWKCTFESEPVATNKIADALFRQREKQFTKRLLSTYSAQDFDAVFCSTFYYFPLLTAHKISQQWHLPLIVDVRDIAEQWGKASYFTSPLPRLCGLEKILSRIYVNRNIRMRNRVLRHATAVTTVSPWHQTYLQTLTKAPVTLIYNGYDEAELSCNQSPVTRNPFSIVFLGRLISLELRQPQLLFQAVSELDIPVQLDFYSEPNLANDLRQLAAQYHVEHLLHLHDYISRDNIGEVMSQASILLALGAPSDMQQHGILGTKVFEAIGIEKPFMLIPSDKENLAQLIRETGIGIAASNTEEIKAFITQQYSQWQQNGFTRCTIADKSRFSRQHAAQEFEELINDKIVNDQMVNDQMVNVVVPAYNAGKYLAECLCSVKNQTYEHWHCIIVDDGSTDNTVQIAQAFVDADSRFTLLRHTTNRGQSAARNTAMDYVSSLNAKRSTINDFITFLDADDWLDKDYLQTLVSNIGDKDILQVGYRRVADNGLILEQKTPHHFYQFTSPCLRLYRAKYLLQAGRFPEGMIYEDVIFSLNIWGSKPSYRILPYIGYNYRFNELSTTSQPNPAARKTLFAAIRQTKAPWWLQRFTALRLKMHFRHE